LDTILDNPLIVESQEKIIFSQDGDFSPLSSPARKYWWGIATN
jgi:hypothetical protein